MLVINQKSNGKIYKFEIDICTRIKELFVRDATICGFNRESAEENAESMVKCLTDTTEDVILIIIKDKFYVFDTNKNSFLPAKSIPFPTYSIDDGRIEEFNSIKKEIEEEILGADNQKLRDSIYVKCKNSLVTWSHGIETTSYKNVEDYFALYLDTETQMAQDIINGLLTVIYLEAVCIFEIDESVYILKLEDGKPVLCENKFQEPCICNYLTSRLGKYLSKEEIGKIVLAAENFFKYGFFYNGEISIDKDGRLQVKYESIYGNLVFTRIDDYWLSKNNKLKLERDFLNLVIKVLNDAKKRGFKHLLHCYPNEMPFGKLKCRGWKNFEEIRNLIVGSEYFSFDCKQESGYRSISDGHNFAVLNENPSQDCQLNFFGYNDNFIKLMAGIIDLPQFFAQEMISGKIEKG